MSGPDLEWCAARPHPALRHLVRQYIGYRQHGVTLTTHRGLPSGSITLIISLADPIRVVGGPGTGDGPRTLTSLAAGLHLAPALIEQDRYQHGIQLELNPLGARALLGAGAAELTSAVVDLADLPVRWGARLAGRLAELPGWDERFALLDKEFRAALRPVRLLSEIQWAWRDLRSGTAPRSVAGLAEEIGWSRRHFSERFGREVGVSPKQASRLIRFERSAGLIRAGHPLADVAQTAGFYDQAHFTNEWRALAGCTPGTWIAEELPFLQDQDSPGAADSTA